MIYISGKISNTIDYLERFSAAEETIKREYNSAAINPATVTETLPMLNWDECMTVCLELLKMSDTIYMLKGWENSKGANIEYKYAVEHGYKIIFE